MVEMELKATIEDCEKIRKRMGSEGCEWSPVQYQVDTIYERRKGSAENVSPIFRIRKCDGKIYLTLKVLEEDVNTANEFEMEISDEKVMGDILRILDFEEKVKVRKKRQTTTFRGFNICLDDVEKLGTFIEIEKLSEDKEEKIEIYNEMRVLLFSLGVREKNFVILKYYEMLLMNKESVMR